ncbi:hypothetical protein BX600DRAFT_441566 [Xylariales sp. PMI_506]|nr:hypothetical protein BX600DRAFT_441566 [Xylariales sp. PMI_506]
MERQQRRTRTHSAAQTADPPQPPRRTAPHRTDAATPLPQRGVSAEQVWTERLILAQSPVWIAAVALVMLTGALRRWDDAGYLGFSLAAAAPSFLLPAALSLSGTNRRPWASRYWFKLHVWVAIMVFFGTYFGTHYFFDLMGMRYAFDVRWTLDSHVLGCSGQRVPVFMYPLTHAYFMTYFAALLVADRAIASRLRLGPAGRVVLVLILAYAVAFAETFFMASSLLSDLFAYQKRDRMLSVGSFGYATYFIVGLPSLRRMDADGEVWTLERVVIEALAACMAILVLLELWAKVVGPL